MGRRRRNHAQPCCYHVTHRCQEGRFLFRFEQDRENYRRRLRLMAAKYDVDVLDYMVTCNHVHLLVWTTGGDKLVFGDALVTFECGPRLQPPERSGGIVLAGPLSSNFNPGWWSSVAVPVIHRPEYGSRGCL